MSEVLTGGIDVTLVMLLWLLAAGALAGWIDAVVGGGGLIQLPALLLVPGMTPVQAVATNKVGSIAGTTASAVTYLRRVTPDRSATIPAAATAFLGAVLGAKLATLVPSQLFTPIILAALVAVGLFTLLNPSLGADASLRFGETSKRHHALSWLIGLIVGIYDGVLGPGTGSFLVIAFVSIIGFSFLQASATAKVVNWATNFGALVYFVPDGQVVWLLGLVVAAGNVTGGIIGARTAIAKGSGFVRIVFIVVVSAMVLKLGYDVVTDLIR
ncbi:TSUP family transporter [Brevibacterium ammoniilyticum]|uniref:Probable membrane transporter protein n=1 Tax=Brevibacterium ammoniilyticum TaxID=1046555 RepID=A0ABP9U4I3_9MICO